MGILGGWPLRHRAGGPGTDIHGEGKGVPVSDQIPQHALVKSTHDELLAPMASGETRATRKARQVPFYFIIAFEKFVVDDGLPLYWLRCSWCRRVRVWACLRFADHRGLLPSSLRMVGGSLGGTLVRSKTTGTGTRRGNCTSTSTAKRLSMLRLGLRSGGSCGKAAARRGTTFWCCRPRTSLALSN